MSGESELHSDAFLFKWIVILVNVVLDRLFIHFFFHRDENLVFGYLIHWLFRKAVSMLFRKLKESFVEWR